MTLIGFRGVVAYECQIGRLVLRVIHLRAAYWRWRPWRRLSIRLVKRSDA